MESNSQSRAKLKSRLGFILLSAGCAIGVGNVWKFPWMVGQYGGGIFVLLYLVFLVIMGVPVMTMEFSIGRASKKSPVCMYDELPGSKVFKAHGWASYIGMYVLMSFYTVVCGWMLYYFWNTANGTFQAMGDGVTDSFGNMLADPLSMLVFTVIVVVLGFSVNSVGVEKGVERVTKFMMIALLILMAVLAIYCCTLEGAGDGLSFYLIPDVDKMLEVGIINVISAAMLQALFTLSLGMGAMAIFGSYIGRERSLLGESIHIAALDTMVALVAGFIIFPACFTYANGVTTSGPGLIFSVLPSIFNNMPFGRVLGSLFFVFMSFAALSTILTVFEGIIACSIDKFGWSRKKSCGINAIILLITSIPCVLGFNLWSGFAPLGKNVQDWEDFLVSYFLLPLGSLAYVLFCTNKKIGWGIDNFAQEANCGSGLKIKKITYGYMKYVLPVIMLVVFIFGILSFFGVSF